MGSPRQYGDLREYQRKLWRVMERFGVQAGEFDWNHDRHGAWIEFRRRGQFYRLEQTVAKSQASAARTRVEYGSDCFCQLVLALEDLARLSERGIYDLETWVAGLKALPAGQTLAPCFRVLQFDSLPGSVDEVRERFAQLVRGAHPDAGADPEAAPDRIAALVRAKDEAVSELEAADGASNPG